MTAVIHEGFADFLRIAYDGNLTLDEYVLLLKIAVGRDPINVSPFTYRLEESPDWNWS